MIAKDLTAKKAVDFLLKHKNIRNAADAAGVGYGTMQKRYKEAVGQGLMEALKPASLQSIERASPRRVGKQPRRDDSMPLVKGRAGLPDMNFRRLPEDGEVKRYILTCAQNNTHVHRPTFQSLMALAGHYDAEVMVSRFTYDKMAGGAKGAKTGTVKVSDFDDLWYDPELVPFFCDERVQLAPGLVFCGELNILPTAVRPLSGLETYTGRQSCIVPHVKLAMESIPSGKFEPTKFNYTTGTVTQRNYIQKKAGQKAEFHHCYGALLVEVDSDGSWWVRQLNADSEGVIYDLTVRAANGKVTKGHRAEAINWGDIHVIRLNDEVRKLAWGKDGMFQTLKPRYQFVHDVLDFRARNHHERGNAHKMFERYRDGEDNVQKEVAGVAQFLLDLVTPECLTVVVDSNHDDALERWLREADFKHDPVNAVYYLRLSLAKYEAMANRDRSFHLLRHAVDIANIIDVDCGAVRFLHEDESFVVCPDSNGGIECGMHGHLGPNGRMGSAAAFARMGRKANVGHAHSAGVHDGIYTAGTCSELDLQYNRGPSSWSHTNIVTYANGKRSMVTFWKGKWRA